MNCPFCGGALESYIVGGENTRADAPYRHSQPVTGGRELDTCRSCEGIWFDAGEMAAGLLTILSGKTPKTRPATGSRDAPLATRDRKPCPRCDNHVYSTQSVSAGKVVYWRCLGCQGVWLKAADLREFVSYDVARRAIALGEFP